MHPDKNGYRVIAEAVADAVKQGQAKPATLNRAHSGFQELSPMRFYLSLYLFLAAVYLFTASGRLGLSDGVAMFNVSQSIVTDGIFQCGTL